MSLNYIIFIGSDEHIHWLTQTLSKILNITIIPESSISTFSTVTDFFSTIDGRSVFPVTELNIGEISMNTLE